MSNMPAGGKEHKLTKLPHMNLSSGDAAADVGGAKCPKRPSSTSCAGGVDEHPFGAYFEAQPCELDGRMHFLRVRLGADGRKVVKGPSRVDEETLCVDIGNLAC